MNSVGLRFILRNGAFLDVIMSQPNANAIIHNFTTRYFHVKDIPVISGECQSGNSWCVNRDDVQAVHTVKLETQPPQIKSLLSGGK